MSLGFWQAMSDRARLADDSISFQVERYWGEAIRSGTGTSESCRQSQGGGGAGTAFSVTSDSFFLILLRSAKFFLCAHVGADVAVRTTLVAITALRVYRQVLEVSWQGVGRHGLDVGCLGKGSIGS